MYPPVRNDAPASSRPSTAARRPGARLDRLWAAISEFRVPVVPQPVPVGAAFAAVPAAPTARNRLLRSTTASDSPTGTRGRPAGGTSRGRTRTDRGTGTGPGTGTEHNPVM